MSPSVPHDPPPVSPPGKRPSTGQSRKVETFLNKMPPWQRAVIFLLGAALCVWGIVDVDPSHWAEHGFMIATAEIGLSALRLVFGILLMIPPLGMWVLKNAPLPKFLKERMG